MSRLSVIIVGAGRAGKDLHLNAYRMVPDVSVVAVCDTDVTRAETAAQENDVPHYYPELADALEAHKVDVVSICTPPQVHLKQVREAMDAGAHVLLEKPMAVTTQEAEEMRRHQLKTGMKLCVVHNYKFRSGVQRAISMVQNGEIGNVLHIEKTWLSNGAEDRMVIDKDFWCHELVGGRWAETLPHHLYIPYQFLGPMRVSAVVVKDVHGRWPWLPGDEVLATLENSSATLTVRLSENAVRKEQHLLICGTKGVLLGDYNGVVHLPVRVPPPYKPREVRQFVHAAKGILDRRLQAVRKVVTRTRAQRQEPVLPPRPESGHLPMIQGFINHLLCGAPIPVTWEEAYWTMRTTQEIGKAIEAGSRHDGDSSKEVQYPQIT